MKQLLTCILAAAASLLPAQKKEILMAAKISDVTIYTSAAEVAYKTEMMLEKGQSTIVFAELSPFIVENSVNVSVSDPAVNIITVAEHINYLPERRSVNGRVSALQDSMLKMKRELGVIRYRQEAYEAEKALLFKGEAIGGLSTHGVAVTEIEKASVFFSKRYLELSKELFVLQEREADLTERIRLGRQQVKELETVSVQTASEIRVTVNSPSEKKVTFSFKFLTAKAGWAPVYDFKYEGPDKPLQFVFRANVFNASGTPWQDVFIKLSTADPIRGFALPSLAKKPDQLSAVQDVKFRQIEVVNAIAEYSIAHQYSVPSDAHPYLLDVTAYAMPAGFNYLLIPKLDPFGFLMARIPGWNQYNLIPGTANIYNSGTYMGKTFLDTYAEDDTLSLYLGKDKNIQATRREKNTYHSRFLVGNYVLEETLADLTVKNTSANTLRVEMADQVPVCSKTEKMSVNSGSAAYNREEGLLTWRFSLPPGETLPITFKYEIRTPKEDDGAGGKLRRRKFRTLSCPTF